MSENDGYVIVLLILSAVWFAVPAFAEEPSSSASYQQVRELNPLGYWPCDEGQGEVVHDRSGNGNHGKILSVPWRDGFLQFENDVYQWIKIPRYPAYSSPPFSMGGWVFSRKKYRYRSGDRYGPLIIGQPFSRDTSGKLKGLQWGNTNGAMLRFIPPSGGSPGPSLIDVVSGQQKDAIGSVKEKVKLKTGAWQHVLYTYDKSGTGRLYLNGSMVRSADNVPYTVTKTPFVIGGGRWGTWNVGGTKSLDGSVRGMVLFGRALGAEDVDTLYEATRPEKKPSPPERSEQRATSTDNNLEELIATVRNKTLDEAKRARAALKLSEMGENATDAIPVLKTVLENISKRNGTYPPRIEDRLRNALMRALLDIAPEDERVRTLLGKTLAKPLLKTLDWSRSYLDSIRPLTRKGRYMKAMNKLRAHLKSVPKLPSPSSEWGSVYTEKNLEKLREHLPLRKEYLDAYLNRGFPFSDAHYSAYSMLDVRNGITYIPVVERVSWEEVQKQYENNLKQFAEEKPDPDGKWSRLNILKIGPDGSEREELLGGPWLIFDARDAKMDGWSIAIDGEGYIHLTGGQHNHPNRDYWIPGSWKKLDIDPGVMYWVSEDPGRIDSFEFAGGKGNPRSFGGWMNYMQFARSPDGTLFLFGRGRVWSWALQRYDAEERRWTEISGSGRKMMDRARQNNPDWYESLGGTIPGYGPAEGLVAAFQPGAYNFNRAWPHLVMGIGGVEFDRTGRMHVQMPILGVGKEGQMTQGPVYAYSDDLGDTFHRADGSPLKLPLTVNPISGHDANMNHHSTQKWFDLWMSLLQEAGWNRKGGFDRYE